MNWAALIALLLEFFGPALRELLAKLFAQATPTLGVFGASAPVTNVRDLFAAARAQTWRFQFATRAKLAVCERIAVSRAPEFFRVMRDQGITPVMLAHERAQVDAVL